MKTTILMVSRPGKLHPSVEEAIFGLGLPLIRYEAEREFCHPDGEFNRCINIAKARNEVRKLALLSDCTHFLFLDSDVVPPPYTHDRLSRWKLPIVGGWFPMKDNSALWVGGWFLSHDLFSPFSVVMPGLYRTDLISMGCALIERSVLERFDFAPGIDQFCRTTDGRTCHLADSGDFSRKLLNAKIQPYLDGDVVCRHLDLCQ